VSAFTIAPATRQSVKPLIGLYGKSGGGKTLSALFLMRGIVGAKGRIVGVDTENGRMSMFADLVPGGYATGRINPPFTPDAYWDAIQAVSDVADGIVIDSFTHEWAGEGGVLDAHETYMEGKGESYSAAAWARAKMPHKRLVERLLRLDKPLIVCLRGEEKTHFDRDAQTKKMTVYTDKFTTPISDPRFIFEMTVHAECYQTKNASGYLEGGYLRITKIPAQVIPHFTPQGQQVTIAHGESLARWCQGGSATDPVATKTPIDPIKVMKSRLWKATAAIHNQKPDMLVAWLRTNKIISETDSLESLTVEQLPDVIDKVDIQLSQS